MFGREDDLMRLVLLLGLVSAVLSALLTWAVARRYGRARALAVPVLALVAVAAQMWRATGLASHEAMTSVTTALVFAGPALAGALLGLVLSRPRKG